MSQKQGNLFNQKKIAWQRIVFWSISLILSVATFFFMRRLTACWQLTALPGIPPSYCGAESDEPTALPATDLEGTPSAIIPVDLAAPEVDLPRWDGASESTSCSSVCAAAPQAAKIARPARIRSY